MRRGSGRNGKRSRKLKKRPGSLSNKSRRRQLKQLVIMKHD